jgi:primosomal protein N' (replication factor Y) (superfamily II helicase)
VVRVALDVPLAQHFDFLCPPTLSAVVGSLVVVPFGRRRMVGLVIEYDIATDLSREKLREVEAVRQDARAIDTELLGLFSFCANYYHAGLGQIALNAIPPRLRAVAGLKAASQQHRIVAITQLGRDGLPTLRKSAVVQQALLTQLLLKPAPETQLRQRFASASVAQLLARGWIEFIAAAEPVSDVAPLSVPEQPARNVNVLGAPTLNAEQTRSVEAIVAALGRYQPFLLDGVTGSGKTEVYLGVIAQVMAAGKQALVLVPEINLTPAFLRQVSARFPLHRIVSAHSGMAGVARLQAWQAAQDGDADIVIGTRLAVFTPMPRLGLIIVDEEHDPSFKQQEGVRYSARDVAVFRASVVKCSVILGSATPSIESLDNVARDRFTRLVLSARAVADAALPSVRFVDLDAERAVDGLTATLIRAIEATVKRGEQAMVFINRRGFAPALVCTACGWMPECRRCSARMVFHRAAKRLRCHHCGAEAPVPTVCGDCGSKDLHAAGQGSERIEEALAAALPGLRIARVDRDSTRRRGSAEKIFAQAQAGQIDVLVGTQMLAKGHDFPRLTLVCVVNADGAVFSADFRAAERMAQQLMQVAGRAGRAKLPGQVLVQTRFGEHPVYQALASHDYAQFVRSALAERKSMHLPPYTFLSLLRAESHDAAKLDRYLRGAQQSAQRLAVGNTLRVWEPVVATLERKAGYVRKQLMIQADSRRDMQVFLSTWVALLRELDSRGVRWILDVDPVEV